MLNELKPVGNDGKPVFIRQQRRLAGNGKKHIEEPIPGNSPWQDRIAELEEEIARLHSTIKFFQDMYLFDD